MLNLFQFHIALKISKLIEETLKQVQGDDRIIIHNGHSKSSCDAI